MAADAPRLDLGFDRDAAVARLMRFLAVEGVTGREKAIAAEVARALQEAGVPAKRIRHDKAHRSIPLPTETGNLLVTLPGTLPKAAWPTGRPVLFMTHLDTVPLCAGVVPVRVSKNRIESKGETALGGDNRTGVAALVTLAATLIAKKLPHPPIVMLFTVREESGLFGARHLDVADLGDPVVGFNIDGREPATLTIGATGAQRWQVDIQGKASHAGAYPEHGISASLVVALALAEVHAGGWFGKITKDGGQGTSNVGTVAGRDGRPAGDATNVVTDYAHVKGEARSHDGNFSKRIVKAYADAFTNAACRVRDHNGNPAKVKFASRLDYHPFRLKESSPVVRWAQRAATLAGFTPVLKISNGGLDANWMVRHGVPTVTFGAGQHEIHTVNEYVDVPMFLDGCTMALALATCGEHVESARAKKQAGDGDA